MAAALKEPNFSEKFREGVMNLESQATDLLSLVEANKRQASVRGTECLKQFQTKVQDIHTKIVQLKDEVFSTNLNFDFDDTEHLVDLEKRMNDSGDHHHDGLTFIKYNFPGTPPVLEQSQKDQLKDKDHTVTELVNVTVEFTPGLTTKRPDSTKKSRKRREPIRPLKMFQREENSGLVEKKDFCQPIIPLTPRRRGKGNPQPEKSIEKTRRIEPLVISKALDKMQTSLGQSTPTQPIPTRDFIKTAKLVRSLKKVNVGTPQLPSSSVTAFAFNDKSRILRPRK